MGYKSYFNKFTEKYKQAEKKALTKIGLFVEGDAKLRCPVDTGNLRGSIVNEVIEREHKVRIGTNVKYALFVFKGTSRQRPQPTIEPAIIKNIDKIKKILKEAFTDV